MPPTNFTLEHYSDILQRAAETFTFSDFFTNPDHTRRIYLRHDVDVSMENAVELAEIEATYDITSTYFVPINSPYYNLFNDSQLERLETIADLGHSIGIHLDERAEYMAGFTSIEAAASGIYAFLRELVPVERVVSFHMPSRYEFTRREAIGDFVNGYSTTFNNNENVKYLSDSGRRWEEGCFCEHLDDPDYHSYQLLIHPIWWYDDELSDREVYQKIQTTNQQGLKVNLENDIQIFSEL